MGTSALKPEQRLPGETATAGRSAAVRTTGRWFGPEGRRHLGWLSHPESGLPRSAILILPPVGYDYQCSHRALRVLAERLARQAHSVLRIDYDGTGDSAGDQWDLDRVQLWRDTAAAAADELRLLGCEPTTIVGVRLGATFALLDGGSLGAERIVAWAPVVSGHRLVKELRLLSSPVPESEDPLDPPGTLISAGNVFSTSTLAALDRLAVTRTNVPPAPRVLVVDDPAGSANRGVAHLRSIGTEVDHLQLPGGELALETPPELATLPEEILDQVCEWLGAGGSSLADPPGARGGTRMTWQGTEIQEDVISLGAHRHVGLLSSPLRPDPTRSTVVFLNPGSETHVGPGRAWVEYSRSLAARGYRAARVDFRGWGESPDEDRAPGRPYDACGEDDAVAIAQALRAAGHERVVLCGLCASAWIALRAALHAPVAGVIALNPQLYWQPGDPVEIDWDLIRARRAQEIRRIARGDRWRLWSLLDVLGHRPPAGAWLDELEASGVPIQLLFAEHDDGLVFLRQRLGRRLAKLKRTGRIAVRELPAVDHPMHLTWLRPRVVEALHEALERIDAADT